MSESIQKVPLVLLGCGGVGRALLRQVVDQRAHHASHHGLRLAVAAVADSTGALCAPDPQGALDDARLLRVEALKADRRSLVEEEGAIDTRNAGAASAAKGEAWWLDRFARPGVLVDCTASAALTPALRASLGAGWQLALANKLPLVGAWSDYADLAWRGGGDRAEDVLRPRRGRAMWEATVGSGLPVIATLERLVDAGDTVRRIAGTFSGTMNFLTNGLRTGRRYSELVREARAMHYTEPDPRTDLGGLDMARKALILARGCGRAIDMADVAIEPLYPPELDDLDVDGFMAALDSLDEGVAARVAAAAAQEGVLRYLAEIDLQAGVCRVGPTVVPTGSPLGLLRGTDNLVTFHTRWYDPTPLVLQGRGAGVDATAAGVLADVVQLASRSG